MKQKDRSAEWELIKDKYKNASMEELTFLIIFMQVFGEDIVLDCMEYENRIKNIPDKMNMELAGVKNCVGCIAFDMDGKYSDF